MNEEELIAYLDYLLAQRDATRVEGLGDPGPDVSRTLLGPVAEEIGFLNDNVTQLIYSSPSARLRRYGGERRRFGPGTTPGIRRQQQAIFDAAPVGPIQVDPMTEFIDSLQTIVGGDVGVTRGDEINLIDELITGRGLSGFARPFTEGITITKTGERYDPRRTIGHEFGHISHFRDLFPAGEEAMREEFPSAPGLRGRVKEGFSGVPWKEQYATSFGKIFTRLSSTANDSDLTLDNFIEEQGVKEHERPLLVDMLNSSLFRDHPLSHEAFSESIGRTESLKDMPQDVTKVDDPRTPRPELSRGENLFRNIVEGLDPTFGLATSWAGLRPDDPSLAIQLAVGMFTGGSLVKGSKAVIKKLFEKGSRITPADFNNLPSVQSMPGAEVATGQRRIVGVAIRIDEDIIIASPHAKSHMDLTTDIMSGKGGEAALRGRIEPLYNAKVEHSSIFGFSDNKGNFLIPSEAAAVAYDAGQITRRQALIRSGDTEFFGRLSPSNKARYPHRVIDGEDRFFIDLWSEDLGPSDLFNRAVGSGSSPSAFTRTFLVPFSGFSPPIPLSKP